MSQLHDTTITLVYNEVVRARQKHPRPYASAHEAFAIIREELDEYWDEVKADGPREKKIAELTQIAATAMRAIEDLFEK